MKELCSYSKIIAYFWDYIPKISPLIGNLGIVKLNQSSCKKKTGLRIS